jgi:hypothetical protein
MGKATHRSARPGETLFGGGIGTLIPLRPLTKKPSSEERALNPQQPAEGGDQTLSDNRPHSGAVHTPGEAPLTGGEDQPSKK